MLSSLFSNSERKKCIEILKLYGLQTSNSSYWYMHFPKRCVEEITKMGNGSEAIFYCEDEKLIFD